MVLEGVLGEAREEIQVVAAVELEGISPVEVPVPVADQVVDRGAGPAAEHPAAARAAIRVAVRVVVQVEGPEAPELARVSSAVSNAAPPTSWELHHWTVLPVSQELHNKPD